MPSCSRSSATTRRPGSRRWERYQEVVDRSSLVVVDRPGQAGRAARRRRLDPGRGAPARGVEHRPAGPLHRRPPARLPRHRTGARRDRRSAISTGGTSDGIGVAAHVAPPSSPSSPRSWRSWSPASLTAVGRRRCATHAPGVEAADTVPELRLPVTPTALIGVVDDADVLTSVVALVLAPNGVGGSIVVLPATGDSSLGLGDDRFPLAETYAVRGPEAFALEAEALAGISFDVIEVVDAARLAEIVAPLGELTVDLPADVVDDDSDQPLFEAGPVTLSGADAASVLTARVAGSARFAARTAAPRGVDGARRTCRRRHRVGAAGRARRLGADAGGSRRLPRPLVRRTGRRPRRAVRDSRRRRRTHAASTSSCPIAPSCSSCSGRSRRRESPHRIRRSRSGSRRRSPTPISSPSAPTAPTSPTTRSSGCCSCRPTWCRS